MSTNAFDGADSTTMAHGRSAVFCSYGMPLSFVTGIKSICRRERPGVAVLDAVPLHEGYGEDIATDDQRPQPVRKAFMEQQLHDGLTSSACCGTSSLA